MIGSAESTSQQAVTALTVLVYLGPVAVYILWLGLVNSQAGPTLIKARDDFLILALASSPFAVAPILGLVRAGYSWGGAAAAALELLVFLRLLPSGGAGWVVYNLSPRRGLMLADRSLRALGWRFMWDGRTAEVADRHLTLELGFLPWIRSVSLHVRPLGAEPLAADIEALRVQLCGRLRGEAHLPSASGCCLLMCGVGLLALPLWILSRHSAAIAEVMGRMLLS